MLNRRHVLMSAGAVAVTAGAARAASSAGVEAALNRAFDDFFNEALDESPELATSLGLDKGARAAEKAKLGRDSLADVARHKRTQRRRPCASAWHRPQGALGHGGGELRFGALRSRGHERGSNRDFAYGDGVGSPYMLSQITGSWGGTPDFLDSQHTIETPADCEAYVSRLGEFARVMDEECERVRRDVGLGVIPPDFCISGALSQMKTLHAPADKSTLVSSLVDRAKAKGIAGDWSAEATKAYEGKVLPALERQMALLESLQPKATSTRPASGACRTARPTTPPACRPRPPPP